MEFEIPAGRPPRGIELDRDRHLRLTWDDGRSATFALSTLRTGCPCAQCRGLRDQGRPAYVDDGSLVAVDAELVGNWGLLIRWNDGHETGIFSWGLLEQWAALA